MDKGAPPNNLEAEMAVLGSVFIRPECFPMVSSMLWADAFYLPAHREIFEAMTAMEKREMAIDSIAIVAELRSKGALSRLEGGESYLMELAGSVPTSERVELYARIVLDTANKRKVDQLCALYRSKVQGDLSAEELVEGLGADLARIIRQASKQTPRIGELIPATLEEIEKRSVAGPEKSFTGMRSGVAALDEVTWGWEAPDLVVIGADPGGGKTALAIQAALIATVDDDWVGFCANLEMSGKQLTERALSHRARINSSYIRRGELKREDFADLLGAAQKMGDAPLYIEDGIATMREYEMRCRLFRTKFPNRKAFGIFDYIQLAEGEGDGNHNRSQQVGGYARRLKKLAKDLNMVQIAISSLNRDQKDAAEKPPTNKNLKESGDVEYAADTIHLIWNRTGGDDTEVDIFTSKNRKGPKGRVPAWFRGRHYAFLDVSEVDVERPRQPSLLT